MMPSCREVSQLLASGEADAAPAGRRIMLRLHLMMCRHCRRYSRELRQLRETARQLLGSPLDPKRLAALEWAILDRMQRGNPPDGPTAGG